MRALGPRGATVISLAGFAGLCLGYIGWTQRDAGLIAPSAAGPSAVSGPSAVGPSAAASPSAAARSRSGGPGAPGPDLSSEPYASYAYLVWPGPLSPDARLAMTGFSISVTRRDGGIALKVTQDGQPMTSASHFYPGGAKVYVLDSNLGDDGGGSLDYFTTDDGLAVTNARGQVLP